MKLISAIFVVLLFSLTGQAKANYITFDFQYPGPSISKGYTTFSRNLSGIWNDGFYGDQYGLSATNGYGQNNEYMLFNRPLEFNSLWIERPTGDNYLDTLTVSLFDSSGYLLTARTADFRTDPSRQMLMFDTDNVSKALFTFTGGSDEYHDGRIVGWYIVSDILIDMRQIPEPSSLLLLVVGAGALLGVRRRLGRHIV